jgi:A/G-specific adenine glycosylase
MKKRIAPALLQWHETENKREMPWKGEKDPYKVWLSEVILQQTRVEQGLDYYLRFVKKYPTIAKLAKAQDEDVFKLWEGLGYYSRCKNLLFTARVIQNELNGQFPNNYTDLLKLKGVGPYTAAAIASFVFNQPHAVIDGNVFRVLSRVFGINTAIDSSAGKQIFAELAEAQLDIRHPGLYNQAIMDLGATVCKPFLPMCNHCPLQKICTAYATGTVNKLPVKEKKLQKKRRWFYYFILEAEEKWLVNKRGAGDIWENLYEFMLLESESAQVWTNELVETVLKEQMGISKAALLGISAEQRQLLTHQEIRGQFIHLRLKSIPASMQTYQWQPAKAIRKLSFPKFITQYLDNRQKLLFP